MKLAVISDIHGNLPALQAVIEDVSKWQPDHGIVNGDTVNRGPFSPQCWSLIRQQKGWKYLIGNHEEYVLSHVRQPFEPNPIQQKFKMLSAWTAHQMGDLVHELTDTKPFFEIEGCHITHASIHSTREGIYKGMTDDKVLGKIKRETAVFCTAHTHIPFIRTVKNSLIVNCGSVGQPCDNNPLASYARLTFQNNQWKAKIIRVNYDRQQTNQDFIHSGIFEGAGRLLWLIYLEWAYAKDVVIPWRMQYQDDVFAGHIELDKSIECYIKAHNLPTAPLNL